jgi:oxygen-independent coproporphyrinogen-3 oxidase
MNRASIGVQDFDDDIQQAIGRIQGYEVTRDTVEALRAHGIQSLNADILYGLPHQNQARIAESVQMLLSLSPDRVALYGYAHVPWMAKRQAMIPTDALPTPEERLHLYNTARRLFLWDGYDEIGIDHFARPTDSMAVAARTGHLRRNFQGYTDDTCDVLIGLGASAISRFPQGFAQNASATAQYAASVREGQMATGRGHAFKGDDLWRGRMIEMLLCTSAIDSAAIREEFGTSPATPPALYKSAAEAFPGMTSITPEGSRSRMRAAPRPDDRARVRRLRNARRRALRRVLGGRRPELSPNAARINSRVYSWRGLRNNASVDPVSTTSPCASRSHGGSARARPSGHG